MSKRCRYTVMCASLLLCGCVYYCKGDDDDGGTIVDDQAGDGSVGRSVVDNQQWKALEQQYQGDTSGWIATTNDQNHDPSEQPQKRRRLRKRKRRPQPITSEEEAAADVPVRPRRRRPIRLDEVRDTPWMDVSEEMPRRQYSRRRIGPVYQQSEEMQQDGVVVQDHRRSTTSRPAMTTTVQDIKALLKQTEGRLSLSEVLQQRNLSLSDLLKGKQQAILALSERPEVNTEIITEYRNPVEDEVVYKRVYAVDVVTEATTEKRIFVPSHPKLYTSFDYKPDIGLTENRVTSTEAITTTEVSVEDNVIARREYKPKLPITSAKMKKQRLNENDTELPAKAFKIDINDLFGYDQLISKEVTENYPTKGPFKMAFDIEELIRQNKLNNRKVTSTRPPTTTTTTTTTTEATTTTTTTTKRPTTTTTTTTKRPTTTTTTTKRPTTTTTTKMPTTKYYQQKLKTVSAKDEIDEVMSDVKSKSNLSKILRSRNMTVEELVEQRERGSSQRHLADIFHNNTKEPEPRLIVESKIDGVEREAKSSKFYDIKSLPDVTMSEEIIISERIPSTSFPTYKIETKQHEMPVHIPIWKTIYPSVYSQKEPQVIEDIESTLPNEEEPNPKQNYNDYDDYIQLPLGVKSAIFASLAIVATSLILFLTILVIFKWSQRHKKRLCYGGSFSCSRIKSPILDVDPKRSLRTFMSETLGRKKNVYKSHLQSMSDSWDSDNKPYQ